MLKNRLIKVQIFLIVGALLIASCGGASPGDPTPTIEPTHHSVIETQAVGTFAAGLTMTALAAPTNTPVPTNTPAPTIPALATSTGGTPFGGATVSAPVTGGGSTGSCYAMTFVKDVSVPDNTQMDPGEKFTKTWQVLNAGTCAWDAGFKFQNTGGNAMSATALTLPSAVPSGATFDLSVPMTAPSANGTARGNWRMSTAGGEFFGDEVFVQIVVGNAPAATNTSAPAAADTATPTSTAETGTENASP